MLTGLLTESDVPEREMNDRTVTNALDRLLSRMAAVQRYRIARKYCRGVVVDAACGCGYGSWLLSKCPDVSEVHGFDIDAETVAFARQQYPEATFHVADFCGYPFAEYLRVLTPDTVVSLETIEHLPDVPTFVAAIRRSGATRWVVSFPSFETVRFNPYHLRDWTLPEIVALVGHPPVKAIDIDDAVCMAVFDL